jgi:arginyl-tRNA--protein-N-Asp/Glu arginylyltransferase
VNSDFTWNDQIWEMEIEGQESQCSYLPSQTSRMTYRLAYKLSEARYEQLLSRGWRRFGRTLFRPACSSCRACQSIRICIADFQPSKSQRRCFRSTPDVECIIQKPRISDEHIDLYNRYHLDMHHRRQWPFREITREQYFESFMDGHFSFAREFQYRLDGKLIALGLVDVTPRVMSSIYFFHDPSMRDAAIGTYSVLCELEDGKKNAREHLYMGYYIRDCGSMNYKNRFRPHQFLQKYVTDTETPCWNHPVDEQGASNEH